MRRDAVDDRAHRVLAHAEVKVAAGVAPAAAVGALRVDVLSRGRIEIAEVLERGVGRGIEIGGAARQCRHARRDRVHHLAGSHARRHSLGVGGKHRHVRVPVARAARRAAFRRSSSARSGNALAYAAMRALLAASSRAPRATASRKCASASSGIRNAGSTASRDSAWSGALPRRRAGSHAPRSCPACSASRSRCGCAPESATGASVSARAARSAASIAARSLPSGTDTVCQP